MKKSIKLLTASLAISMISGFVFSSITVRANAPIVHYKLKSCVVTEGGEVTMVGNTCTTGEGGCQSNPCVTD